MHYLFTIQSTKAQTSFAKQTIVFLIGILLSITSQATNYYFSSSTGNDSYTSTQAQNQATPWKSIAKLNSFFSNIVAGDIIYLKRGDIFYGQIVINKSGTSGKPILITAYGSGNKPVLTGFTTISAWVNEGSGIYSSTISSPTQTNMVAIDNVQYAMGRYPDATYRTFQSFVTNISITDNTLGTGTNWTGAEVVIRKNDWTIDRCRITAHSGNTLSYYSLGSAQSPYANFGYFIQNDLRTLTTYGEWFHNINNGKFYMYFGSVSPSTKVVQVATTNNVIAVGGYDYITLDNLNIKGSIDNGIQYSGGNDYCVVQNCDVVFGGKVGIGYSTGNGSIINNNTVKYCNGGGINSDGTSSTITNNTVANIGNFKGQALGGSYNGIGVVGNGVVVRNNYVHNIGATGINLKYTGAATIQYNLIDTVCTLLDDGAGIYTSGSNTSVRLIDHNIIMNVVGNSEGTNNNSPLSAGIFLDEKSTNVVISNNTIANVPYNGIKFHHSTNNTITDNTTYNNNYGIYFQSSSVAGTLNNQMRRNIFFAKLATQYSMQYYTDVNSLYTLASDSNYFVRPMEPNLCVQYQQPSTNYYWINSTIPAWTTISGEDVHSKKSPKTITNLSDLNFQYNASGTSKVVPFAGLSYVDATGTVYNNSVTIPAWGSKVLIANGLATTSSAVVSLLPAVNPAYTINGLDYKYYEGSWSVLPAFSTLTPIKTGNTTNFTTAVANRSTQYGLNFTGYINVPADGQYTFYTSSDDGSSLYIDNNLVVTNDGIHPTTEKSGTIGLKAGKHAINGLFFQADGGQVFAVSYSSTSIPKQVIPASALYRVNLLPAVNPANTINGLDYKYYEGNWLVLPSFPSLTPVKTGATSTFTLSVANKTLQYGLSFTGYINVPVDGLYTFYTSSDDGSKLYIDNNLVVTNDGIHPPTEKSGIIGLKAGKHAINGLFFQQDGGQVFLVSYSGTGITKQAIPASALYRVNTVAARIASNNQGLDTTTASMTIANNSINTTQLKINTYPNPTTTEFALDVEGGNSENIEILVVSADGKIVFKATGTSNKIYRFGKNFGRGLYIIKVIQSNTIQSLKVIKI